LIELITTKSKGTTATPTLTHGPATAQVVGISGVQKVHDSLYCNTILYTIDRDHHTNIQETTASLTLPTAPASSATATAAGPSGVQGWCKSLCKTKLNFIKIDITTAKLHFATR
jgi:hypothetical protein